MKLFAPKVLATMHGSVFMGDGESAMRDHAVMINDVLRPRV